MKKEGKEKKDKRGGVGWDIATHILRKKERDRWEEKERDKER